MQLLRVALAWLLIVAGFLILLLPGPAGWPGLALMIPGLLLLMRTSRGARKWFVQASRQDPKMFGRVRRWLGRRNRERRGRAAAGAGSDADTRPGAGTGGGA
jgi:hypothetical protein